MDRSRSKIASGSPSSVPTPVSLMSTPQGIRRAHLTPNAALVDTELSFSKASERISPFQRTPTEAATPRLAAAVSEAKRSGATAPSPIQSSTDAPMDQFDRMLSRNPRISNTPSLTPPQPQPRDDNSPVTTHVQRIVQAAVCDEQKRRDLMQGISKIIGSIKPAPPSGSGAGSRGSAIQPDDAILRLARTVRDLSPSQLPVSNESSNPPANFDPRVDVVPQAFTQRPKAPTTTLCKPKPSDPKTSKLSLVAEELAKRNLPTKQKILRSELSAFSETEESNSLTSHSTVHTTKSTSKPQEKMPCSAGGTRTLAKQ